jgi:hypothetical protein
MCAVEACQKLGRSVGHGRCFLTSSEALPWFDLCCALSSS